MNSPCLLRELLITHSPTCLKKVISTHFLRWLLKVSLVSLLREARLWVPARAGSGSSSCHPHSHHVTQGVCWQMQPPACLIWSLGLGVDEASRVGLQEGVVHTRQFLPGSGAVVCLCAGGLPEGHCDRQPWACHPNSRAPA